jgi:hypothetical protein
MAIGVGLAHTGHEIGDPLAAVGSLVIFADTALLAWLVFQDKGAKQPVSRQAA